MKFNIISTLFKLTNRFIRKFVFENIIFQFYWNPPYIYVQNITINNVCNYLNIKKNSLKSWCIVGVHLGREIKPILNTYPNVKIDAFECSERYVDKLKKGFAKNSRVRIIEKAVSSEKGKCNFYETSLQGNGSLLKLGRLSQIDYGNRPKEEFIVETTTLDSYYNDRDLDVLWVDVQGAERLVLEGAKNTLKNLKAVFIEVSVNAGFYEESASMQDLNNILVSKGFKLVLLGTDANFTGNALYIKNLYTER